MLASLAKRLPGNNKLVFFCVRPYLAMADHHDPGDAAHLEHGAGLPMPGAVQSQASAQATKSVLLHGRHAPREHTAAFLDTRNRLTREPEALHIGCLSSVLSGAGMVAVHASHPMHAHATSIFSRPQTAARPAIVMRPTLQPNWM